MDSRHWGNHDLILISWRISIFEILRGERPLNAAWKKLSLLCRDRLCFSKTFECMLITVKLPGLTNKTGKDQKNASNNVLSLVDGFKYTLVVVSRPHALPTAASYRFFCWLSLSTFFTIFCSSIRNARTTLSLTQFEHLEPP